jgi:hypothetical protein
MMASVKLKHLIFIKSYAGHVMQALSPWHGMAWHVLGLQVDKMTSRYKV